MNKTKLVLFVFVISIIIKLILMPISVHSDLFATEMLTPLLYEENVIDIYTYMDNKNLSYFYPPLSYYAFASFTFPMQLFSQSIIPWLDSLRFSYLYGVEGQAVDYIRLSPNKDILRDLFLAKLPFLIFDLASIWILLRLARDKLIQRQVLIIWMLNPVIIYTSYIFGQFDIIVLFFILLGFFLLRKNPKAGILSLGIAGAFKSYPFVIVLPAIIIYGKSFKERLILLLVAFSPFLLSTIPTLINSPHLLFFTFFPKNLFHYKETIQGWEKYSQFIKYGLLAGSYLVILLLSAFLKIKDKWRFTLGISLVTILLALTLAGRTHFHYLIWEMTLLILWYGRRPKALSVIILVQTISFASYKILANQLQLGLFAPLNPDYFSSLPTFNSIINQIIPYRVVSTLGFITFTIINLYLIINILSKLIFKTEVRKIV